MTFFGLPIITALFVFMGPLLALVLSVVFARSFRADTEEWGLLDGRAKRAERPEKGLIDQSARTNGGGVNHE